MIKKFDEFKVNELKSSTYYDAARKLRKLGGKHIDKAHRLERHSIIMFGREFGEFNVNLDIIEKMSMNYLTKKEEMMSFVKQPSEPLSKGETMVQKSPISIYITAGLMANPLESFNDDEIQACSAVDIMFFGIPSQDESFTETIELFMLSVPIDWEGETFKISDSPVSVAEMEYGVVKFADRKSANKFRSLLSDSDKFKNLVDGIDGMREFFMTYSTGTELDKLYKKLSSMSANTIYA